ncbi:3'(2'),5'-bisphosphate nucleotidase CysQ [uncultured Sphingomonas sp.]|uniref:3'(2'),5'-bisphosphate nucleotidase CysQ n=1 Tax=uncultured Sphingomonas sp. TaxID=158754 RepID=UPI0025CC4AF4|nr:3'(2'),5'-bisphosphate nucleotidase CysQ [uncultured Sphingomonas sp.]
MTEGDFARDRDLLLANLAAACVEAGEAIMAVYATDFAVVFKDDASPVTEADQRAEAIILKALAWLLPGIPVIAEEEVAAGNIPATDGRFLLVDPLDGTKEFVGKRGDFTVNVALIEDHAPALGIVYAPVERRLFMGDVARQCAWSAVVSEDGRIGERQPIAVRMRPAGGLAAVASRSHNSPATEAYLDQFDVASRVSRGSSLKICMVAAGEADLYPRLAPTCEWDIAAGDAVLRAAGGRLDGPDGRPMVYGKPDFFNTGFVAAGDVDAPPIAPFL